MSEKKITWSVVERITYYEQGLDEILLNNIKCLHLEFLDDDIFGINLHFEDREMIRLEFQAVKKLFRKPKIKSMVLMQILTELESKQPETETSEQPEPTEDNKQFILNHVPELIQHLKELGYTHNNNAYIKYDKKWCFFKIFANDKLNQEKYDALLEIYYVNEMAKRNVWEEMKILPEETQQAEQAIVAAIKEIIARKNIKEMIPNSESIEERIDKKLNKFSKCLMNLFKDAADGKYHDHEAYMIEESNLSKTVNNLQSKIDKLINRVEKLEEQLIVIQQLDKLKAEQAN